MDNSLNTLLDFKNGKLDNGWGLGIPLVDKYLVYKPNSFSCTIARDNVGKTFWKCWYYVCLAKLKGLRMQIFAKENETWVMKLYIVEFVAGKSINLLTDDEIKKIDVWIFHHFVFLDTGLLTFDDIIKKALENNVHLTWIDPYNGLSKPSGINSHEYDYEVIRKCNEFKKTHGSIDISLHPVTELNRMIIKDVKDEFNNFPMPARKWHAEGGGKWQNGVDQFLSMHRFTTHPTAWLDTRIYVDKVRVTQTGGKPTEENGYLIFTFDNVKKRFTILGIDPLETKNKGLDFDKAEEFTLF